MGVYADILGTLRSTFRFGPKATPQTLATAASAARTATFPNKSGTVAMLDDIYAPIANGDPLAPDLIYDDYGDVILGQVYP